MTANGCGRPHDRWMGGCPGCQTLSRMYDRRRRSGIADGTWLKSVDAADVRVHVDRLIEAGMNLATIAVLSGLAKSTVLGVRKRQWVQGPTAEALFAVKPAPVNRLPSGMVPVAGASRRVRALCWMGWSLQAQADHLGMYLQQVWQVANARQSTVTEATDGKFRGLFERLSATRGPSRRAHNAAVRKGWLPPLAWDDIDDSFETPTLGETTDAGVDDVAVSRALEGERLSLTVAEQAAALRLAVERGNPLSQVSNMLGINYGRARDLVADGMPDRRLSRERFEVEVQRLTKTHSDLAIAGLLDVHRSTVTKARRRIAARGEGEAA